METPSEKHGSELRHELEALRQRVQDLEADRAGRMGTVHFRYRRNFSKRLSAGLISLAVLLVVTAGLLYGQSAVDALFIDQQGNIGIGTTAPGKKLALNVGGDDGVSLQDSSANELARLMRDGTASNGRLALWAGGKQNVNIKSFGDSFFNGGNVGVGTTSPRASLDVQQGNRTDTHPAAVKGLYVTGDFSPDSGVEFRHSNGTQGIGFGYNTIYATGGNGNQDLNLKPRGNGTVNIQGLLKVNGDWMPAVSRANLRIRFGQQVLNPLPSGLQTLNVTHGETFQSSSTYIVLANVAELHGSVGSDVYTTHESHPISGTQFIVRWDRNGGRERPVVINYLVIGY